MSLDRTEIDRIARLARLALSGSEADTYARELSGILALVERMNAADTASLEPLAHPLELKARLRPDAITESDRRDRFQSSAPAVTDGLYLVPRVVD
jgi:aspartyl-tRNA(Asn)/glutamyl-tRNA(Gln) amidotransferase subunit C